MSGAGVISVTAVNMAAYHDLSEIELGVIVGGMRHSILEVAIRWGFSRMAEREYRNTVKYKISEIAVAGSKILQKRDQRRLKRQKSNPSENVCGFQCWTINKRQHAYHSTKNHRIQVYNALHRIMQCFHCQCFGHKLEYCNL